MTTKQQIQDDITELTRTDGLLDQAREFSPDNGVIERIITPAVSVCEVAKATICDEDVAKLTAYHRGAVSAWVQQRKDAADAAQ